MWWETSRWGRKNSTGREAAVTYECENHLFDRDGATGVGFCFRMSNLEGTDGSAGADTSSFRPGLDARDLQRPLWRTV